MRRRGAALRALPLLFLVPAPAAALTEVRGKRPAAKEIPLSDARQLLDGVIGALHAPAASRMIASAAARPPPDALSAQWAQAWVMWTGWMGWRLTTPGEVQRRLASTSSVLDGLAAPVLKGRGFDEGGLMEALLAVEEAGRKADDATIGQRLQMVQMIVTGEPPTVRTLGRSEQLDGVASGFIHASAAARAKALAAAEGEQEKWETDNEERAEVAGRYVEVMRGVQKEGVRYVEDRLAEQLPNVWTRFAYDAALMARTNVLAAFLTPEENMRVAERMQREEKEQKLAEEKKAADAASAAAFEDEDELEQLTS